MAANSRCTAGIVAMIQEDGGREGMSMEEAEEFGSAVSAMSYNSGARHCIKIRSYE